MCKYRVQAYDPFGFKKLKDVWDKLYEGKDMTYFQSYDWYEIINSMIPLKRGSFIFGGIKWFTANTNCSIMDIAENIWIYK